MYRLRDSIWDPPGLSFGSLLALKTPPRPSQERPRYAQERPRGFQARSKSAQEASQTAPRGLQDRSKRPSGGPGAPRDLWRAIWDPFWVHFGPHFDAKTIPPQACGQLFARHPAAALVRMRHLDNSQHRFPQSSSEDGFHNSRNDPSEL